MSEVGTGDEDRVQLANNYRRLFGFLLGVTLAGASAYYYVIDEYKLGNDMLTEDIYVSSSPLEPYLQTFRGPNTYKANPVSSTHTTNDHCD